LSSAAGAPLGGFMLGIEAAEVPFVGSKYDCQFPPVLGSLDMKLLQDRRIVHGVMPR
jgi:hypothetical protein